MVSNYLRRATSSAFHTLPVLSGGSVPLLFIFLTAGSVCRSCRSETHRASVTSEATFTNLHGVAAFRDVTSRPMEFMEAAFAFPTNTFNGGFYMMFIEVPVQVR
jgi:hypothetical protein